MQRNANEMALKLFKATVTDRLGNIDEVPVWAADVDQAQENAEKAYGIENVGRVRPVVVP
ncbi:host cell RNA polymerase inhibitor [Pseudomonas oryzihabitans]|uniref:host cell RNA polymerase inhibitor n=1 Tax=Pseudomonas oryzihabitans TaxID=47885 RepID=UPI0015E3ED8B|nr:host cell RNA polymerase inhibitor [Pseudomonas psychrotolerans]MBA1211548.1 host cell RNA polymerase inhibitor [Pseudomonas psychrotolerans]